MIYICTVTIATMGNTPRPNWLKNVRRQGQSASLHMLEQTRKLGFEVTEEDMRQMAADSYWPETWTGEMFAEYLLAQPEYNDHPLLVPYRAGGARSDNPYVNLKEKKYLLGGIIDLGVDGIEAFSSYHTPSQTADALAVAQTHGLFVTCGSDFHGKTKPSIALRQHGCTIPGEEMERQMEALLERVI